MKAHVYACSGNPGKLAEFALAARMFAGSPDLIRPLPDLEHITPPEENGQTFEENAMAKAAYYSRFSAEPVFADDSGLVVDALGGKPGILSARFAGPGATDRANNDLLLTQLASIADRRAHFTCVIALAREGRVIQTFLGAVEGEISYLPRGENGFGYDPLFFYPPSAVSFGEMTAEEKLPLSHRGQALRKLLDYLSFR
jgi:XTP/dITP diphosphohydrolase